MKYPFHTSTHNQRLKSLEQTGLLTSINIDDFLVPTIAINEDTNELYEFDYNFMSDTLKQFDNGIVDYTKTAYYDKWGLIKGEKYCQVRISNFLDLYKNIKVNGLKEPVVVDNTGQKIDGSHRASILKHFGFVTIPARIVNIEPDIEFIKRTVKAREKIYGKN